MSLISSTTQYLDPKELRALVHAELDQVPDQCLEVARKLLLELRLQELVDELGTEMDEAWRTGRITQETIAKAIQEYRQNALARFAQSSAVERIAGEVEPADPRDEHLSAKHLPS